MKKPIVEKDRYLFTHSLNRYRQHYPSLASGTFRSKGSSPNSSDGLFQVHDC